MNSPTNIGARSRVISAQFNTGIAILVPDDTAIEFTGGATNLVLVDVEVKLSNVVVPSGACVVDVIFFTSVVVEDAPVLFDVGRIMPLLAPELGPPVSVIVTTLTEVPLVPVLVVTVGTETEVGSLVVTVTIDVVPLSLELEVLDDADVVEALDVLELLSVDEVEREVDEVVEVVT